MWQNKEVPWANINIIILYKLDNIKLNIVKGFRNKFIIIQKHSCSIALHLCQGQQKALGKEKVLHHHHYYNNNFPVESCCPTLL